MGDHSAPSKSPRFRQAIARLIVRAYPRAWRRRFETEMLDLLGEIPHTWTSVADLGRGAAREWLDPSQRERTAPRASWYSLARWLLVIPQAYVAMCVACLVSIVGGWLYVEASAAMNYAAVVSWRDVGFLDELLVSVFSSSSLMVAGVIFAYSLLWSTPIAMALLAAGFGRGISFWIGIGPFSYHDRGRICLLAGGYTVARALFPTRSRVPAAAGPWRRRRPRTEDRAPRTATISSLEERHEASGHLTCDRVGRDRRDARDPSDRTR